MAIKLIANYSKRLGLPGYSSHQFEVSIETEISNTTELAFESERLYRTLQDAVDAQIQQVGFVPDAAYGTDNQQPPKTPAPSQLYQPRPQQNAYNNAPAPTSINAPVAWKCSDKQRDLILELSAKAGLDEAALNELAMQRFGKPAAMLNKMEAFGIIDELMNSGGGNRKPSNSKGGNYARRPSNNYANSNRY